MTASTSFQMPCVKLHNGVEMPQEGFGVFQIADLATCEQVVRDALTTGYRLIDTAASYKNEAAVGKAVRASGIARQDIFVTSKVFVNDMGYAKTKAAFYQSLEQLGLDYLDLYLIHMPYGDYYGSWRALEELYAEGVVRAIGVSNFQSDRFVDLCYNCDVKPMVNQLELHPFYQRAEELKVLQEYGTVPQAWAPFAEGLNGMFTNPLLSAIATAHNRTVAQVVLRWNVQRGVSIIPKSTHTNRMQENMAIWDFALSAEEMASIATLDLGRPQMFDPRAVSEVRRIYDYLNNPVLTTLQ